MQIFTVLLPDSVSLLSPIFHESNGKQRSTDDIGPKKNHKIGHRQCSFAGFITLKWIPDSLAGMDRFTSFGMLIETSRIINCPNAKDCYANQGRNYEAVPLLLFVESKVYLQCETMVSTTLMNQFTPYGTPTVRRKPCPTRRVRYARREFSPNTITNIETPYIPRFLVDDQCKTMHSTLSIKESHDLVTVNLCRTRHQAAGNKLCEDRESIHCRELLDETHTFSTE